VYNALPVGQGANAMQDHVGWKAPLDGLRAAHLVGPTFLMEDLTYPQLGELQSSSQFKSIQDF
jgi:hypothetical protein